MYQTMNHNSVMVHRISILSTPDKFSEMSQYPNVLTPPMDSPDSIMLSPSSGSSSPNSYMHAAYQTYNFNANVVQNHGSAPYLVMREEPVDRFRFRYKSEMAGTHGSLTGKNSDRTRKQTYPTVELCNYDKPVVIRCSLYQYGREEMVHTRLPHAHRLVKRHGHDEVDDPHDLHIDSTTGFTATFHSMGIIHTAKKYIVSELLRKNTKLKEEEIASTEFKARALNKKEELEIKALAEKESKSINLNIVCLRFDAFKIINNVYYRLCPPIYSNSINNLKSALTGDLKIVRMDHCTSPSRGGREIFILVEKVTKKNIKVRFFELDDDDNEVWSDYGRFNDLDVHHQYAIVFKTPPYRTLDIDKQVKVCIELQRPSDGARSEPKDFLYTPSDVSVSRKRVRQDSYSLSSSNFASDELPLTLNNLTPKDEILNSFMNVDVDVVKSIELADALKQNNMDSAEFNKLCQSLLASGSIEELYVENVNLMVDAPESSVDLKPRARINSKLQSLKFSPPGVGRKLNLDDQQLVEKVKNQLLAFLRSKPSKNRISAVVENLFLDQEYVSADKNTVLHLLIVENDPSSFLIVLLKLLLQHKISNVTNLCNNKGQTALHLAVESHNLTVVEHLLYNMADVSIQDLNGNTALHIAVLKNAPNTILKSLLCATISQTYINMVNHDGLMALHLAVQANNIPATKLLCWHNTNVNDFDKKNGQTALHMAIADQRMDILTFLLENTDVDIMQEDFNRCSSLKLAKILCADGKANAHEIYQKLENFMKTNGIFEEIDIKEEVEEFSEDEMEELKEEPVSPVCIKNNDEQEIVFTESCLAELSTILDKSGMWHNLSELLDLGHLLRNNLVESMETPSRNLLELAIANGESVTQIRDFLEHLDELRAVEIIDKMIKEQ